MKEKTLTQFIIEAPSLEAAVALVAQYGFTGKRGFSLKSIYRKRQQRKQERTKRNDSGTVRNHILKATSVHAKIAELTKWFYLKNAKVSTSLTVDLILAHAKTNQEYWELAAIPKRTLYRCVAALRDAMALTTVHRYKNHRNLHNAQQPTITGAFNDLPFMEYIIGDDHKADVAGVWVYDETKMQYVKKQVQIWLWLEAKTRYPLGWHIAAGPLNQRDLIYSLIKVFKKYGLPKTIMIDNGIGRGGAFQRFVNELFITHNKLEPICFSAPYTPTNKAPIERAFGTFKNEFDSFLPNFVGPDKRVESRHQTAALSPEYDALTLDEYTKHFETYMETFFIQRKRQRRGTDSRWYTIQSDFEQAMLTFTPDEVTDTQIRASLFEKFEKKFDFKLTFKNDTFIPSIALPVAFNGRIFDFIYNPYDLSSVDMYMRSNLTCAENERTYIDGEFICTLQNVRNDPDAREKVYALRKKQDKAIREAAKLLNAEHYIHNTPLPYAATGDGKIHNNAKDTEKTINRQLKMAASEIIKIAPKELNEIDTQNSLNSDVQPAPSLTFDDTDEEDNSFSLSFDNPAEQ